TGNAGSKRSISADSAAFSTTLRLALGAAAAAGVGLQPQRRGVDAIALPGGRRTVGKHVAEMRLAARALDLRAHHAVAGVVVLADGALLHRLGEARPTRARVELPSRAEQRLAAAHAAVGALGLGVPVGAGEGALGARAAGDAVLVRGQLLAPL